MENRISATLDLTELRKKVNFTKNALGAAKTDLQTQLIRFDFTGNKLTLFAASKEMLCRSEMKVVREEGAADDSFSVLGDKLAALATTAEAERITLEADQENLRATAGFLTVNLTLYDGASLKQIEQGCSEHLRTEGTAIDRAELEEALTCGKSCTTVNSIRPDVSHVELRKGQLLASDGRKITIYSSKNFDPGISLKVPAGTLSNVISAIKHVEADKVTLHEGSSYYFIKGGVNEHSIGVRKTERTFPDVEQTIVKASEDIKNEIAVDKHVLSGALAGVALGLENDEVKVTFDLEGVGTNAVLEVSALNSLGRRSFERTSCGRIGEGPISFPVSYKHMLDTLSVFKGDSVVDLGINTKLALLMVRDFTDTRKVLTLVPFRTDSQIQAEKAEKVEKEETKKRTEGDSTADGAKDLQLAVEEEVELA